VSEAPGITSAELMELAGISQRQLTHWSERGFLHPEGNGGSGNRWIWPPAEVEVACRMARLVAAGLIVERAAEVARKGTGEFELAPGVLLAVSGG
jgi:hypothetical protein